MRKSVLASLVLLLPAIMMLGGCWFVVGAAAGAGGVVYAKGSGEKSYPVTVEKAHAAAVAMLKSEKIPVYMDQSGPTEAKVEATLGDGSKLTIAMETTGPNVTQVSIRVGFWGDKDRTSHFFQSLDKQLGY